MEEPNINENPLEEEVRKLEAEVNRLTQEKESSSHRLDQVSFQ